MNDATCRAGAADARLPDLPELSPPAQCALEPPELLIRSLRLLELRLGCQRVLAPETPLLEQEAPEIAELELAEPAQVADAAPDPRPFAQTGWRDRAVPGLGLALLS